MSKPTPEVFNLVGDKTFRRSSGAIAGAITAKMDQNSTREKILLDEIAENFETTGDAVVCMVALLGGETKAEASPKVNYIDSLVRKVVFYRQENIELGFTLRNLMVSDNIFYDLSMKDLEKYGL